MRGAKPQDSVREARQVYYDAKCWLVFSVTQSQLTHALQARSDGSPGPADDCGLDWGVSSSSDIIMCTVLYTAVGGRSSVGAWLITPTRIHVREDVGKTAYRVGDEVELQVLGCPS